MFHKGYIERYARNSSIRGANACRKFQVKAKVWGSVCRTKPAQIWKVRRSSKGENAGIRDSTNLDAYRDPETGPVLGWGALAVGIG